MRKTLITGVTGQDGSCLAVFLLEKGYEVRGIKRRVSGFNSQRVDPGYFRPAEVETLLGDPSKAKEVLGWEPEITVEEMCREVIAENFDHARGQALLKAHGHQVSVAKE